MKSYCIKQKKVTDCVPGSEKYVTAKNGRTMMKCTCDKCRITKTKFVTSKKLIEPSQAWGNIFRPMDLGYELPNLTDQAEKRMRGEGTLSTVADTGTELFISVGSSLFG